MKIALVNPFSFSYQGGIQEHVKALYRELKGRGQAVKIIAPRQSREENYGPDFILVGSSIVIPGNDSRVSLSYCLPSEIDGVLNREKFDLFHFHSCLPFLSFQILNAVGEGPVKIMTSHSNIEGSFFATALGGVTEFVVDSFVGNMDAIISVSKAAEKLIRKYPGLKTIIPNGIDTKRFNPNVAGIEKFRDGKINILFVGRLDRRKGMQVLLPAFSLLKKDHENIRLIVVGDGFLKGSLMNDVRREKVGDVVFEGEVKAELTPAYYASADIFCAPSIRGETFGIILLEAMASGVPVVASNIEGYAEVMPKEAEEFLFPAGDFRSLSAVLLRLIGDGDLRRKVGDTGLRHAQNYDWEKVGRRVLDFYEEVNVEKIRKSSQNGRS